MQSTKLKPLYLIFACFLALVLLYGLINALSRQGKSEVTLDVAPSTARIAIDGKPVKIGTVYVRPGAHTMTASLKDFETNKQQITIEQGKPTTISVVLSPANDTARTFLTENPEYQMERERIGGHEVEGRATLAATPLIGILPTSSADISGPYAIDYGNSTTQKDGTVIIISDSSPNGRKRAIAWIRSNGYDPTDLEIQYADFVNPLDFTATGGGE